MKSQLLGFHHIAIIASNYARSKHFYIDILGTKKLNETYRAERDSYKLDLSFPDGSQIELFSFPNPPQRVTNPEACGLRHLHLKSKILMNMSLIFWKIVLIVNQLELMN